MDTTASGTPARSSAQPLFLAALAFACGILFAQLQWRPTSWLLISALLFAAFSLLLTPQRPRIAWVLALVCIAFLGGLTNEIHGNPFEDAALLPSGLTDSDPVEIVAHVTRAGLVSDSGTVKHPESRQTVDVETESILSDNRNSSLSAGIRLSIYARETDSGPDLNDDASQEGAPPELKYGDRIHFRTTLRKPRNFGNPGAWDYRGYLLRQGIVALASVKAKEIDHLPGFSGSRFQAVRYGVRKSILAHMQSLADATANGHGLPRVSRDDTALLAAMIMGEQSLIHRGVKLDFQRTGAYHLLVVSGMNVAITAFVIFWVAQRVGMSPVFATLLTLSISCFYAYMTDLGAPILRAVLMASIILTAGLLYRHPARLNAIGFAGLVILVAQPWELFDPSFQLTFLAVVVIAGIGVPVLERTLEPYRKGLRALDTITIDRSLLPRHAQFRLELRMIHLQLQKLIGRRFSWAVVRLVPFLTIRTLEVVWISALLQVALALPMAVYFHRATVVGFFANVVVVPLMSALMPVAILATLATYVSAWVAMIAGVLTAAALHGILHTIVYLGSARFAEFRLAQPSTYIAVLSSGSLAFALATAQKARIWTISGLALLVVAAGLLVIPPHPSFAAGNLEITAIDVGQGDSILLVTPDGKTLLMDAGGSAGFGHSDFDYGEEVVSPYLWQRGISRLDAVAISHPHSDHIGGMRTVISNFRPKELWIGEGSRAALLDQVLRQANQFGVTVIHKRLGDNFAFGAVNIHVLGLEAGAKLQRKGKNNDSMVLRANYRNSTVLLEGDAEKEEEYALAKEHPEAQVLKVAHHGSATSSTPELLRAVHPQCAIISVGANNLYGHPRPEVLARLHEFHVATHRTDLEGAVTFLLDGNELTPHSRCQNQR